MISWDDSIMWLGCESSSILSVSNLSGLQYTDMTSDLFSMNILKFSSKCPFIKN